MIYFLLDLFPQSISSLALFRYVSFRSLAALLFSLFLMILLGKHFIKMLQKFQFGQVVRNDGPQDHLKKKGTPTMGGVLIGFSFLVSTLLFADISSLSFLLGILLFCSFFILGLLDDGLKIKKKNSKGVSGKVKLVWQFSSALLVSWFLVKYEIISPVIYFPLLKETFLDLGPWPFICFSAFVIVGSSNAVNLTDGLDGLATGPIITSALVLGIFAYIVSHKVFASYLFLPRVAGATELAVIAAAIIGSSIGFLWYNAYPAQLFMGDVGSLSLGGILGYMAVVTRNEILYVVIGGIFVLEAISVLLQVGFFKYTKGKRIFKMAPIHHHFELTGIPEPKVIVRFWIVSFVLAALALSTLKIR